MNVDKPLGPVENPSAIYVQSNLKFLRQSLPAEGVVSLTELWEKKRPISPETTPSPNENEAKRQKTLSGEISLDQIRVISDEGIDNCRVSRYERLKRSFARSEEQIIVDLARMAKLRVWKSNDEIPNELDAILCLLKVHMEEPNLDCESRIFNSLKKQQPSLGLTHQEIDLFIHEIKVRLALKSTSEGLMKFLGKQFSPAMMLKNENLAFRLKSTNFLKKDRELQEKILSMNLNYYAHGVEMNKGGAFNLVNIMLEGRIAGYGSGQPYSGLLQRGPPDFYAGPHGPFYVILSLGTRSMSDGSILENQHMLYLIPDSYESILIEALELAEKMEMITSEEAAGLKRKLITYTGFIERLEKIQRVKPF